ncbi:ATP-binding cassette sub-family G member 1-like [Sabethes cyaneus]|uniref:ATP-binding cassette sub-family G member 1-like n=1 Tax=Sabethes cyaneus TaxID=53552 RepID=UPI00237E3218|nr:ATP-binding cassette sub-family G member 1-like [Sabethes cyaneus]
MKMIKDLLSTEDQQAISLLQSLTKFNGPDQLCSLFAILLQFREYRVGVTGDIEEMFHQVLMREEDQQCHRFFWKDDAGEIKVYVPCAQYVKNVKAERFMGELPEAVDIIKKRHYVDDAMFSTETPEHTIRLAQAVRQLHSAGGFEIRNWTSNSRRVLTVLIETSTAEKSTDLTVGPMATEKMLGMWWCTTSDEFVYKIGWNRYNPDLLTGRRRPTKRQMLLVLMTIFDPLGLISHFLMFLKVLLQEVWRAGVQWDEEIPDTLQTTGDSSQLILDNLCGVFRSGRLTAILGPSGSGKSSLLNILSGLRQAEGVIQFNGNRLGGTELRKVVSYTEQEVSLWMNLTVEESLKYTAEFQMPDSMTKSTKKVIILEHIQSLGLDKCSSTLVRNLSGGEYKRLAIALNLLSNPKVMLLDEPTSGLDIVAAHHVISTMKNLAREGRIIGCVIHQPNSGILGMFDDIYLISKGRCLYNGSLTEMVRSFQAVGLNCPLSHNPADFALEIACLENDERVAKLIHKQLNVIGPSPTIVSELEIFRESSCTFWKQLMLLLRRSTICTLRDPTQMKTKTAISVLVGLLIGTVYYDIGNNAARILSNTTLFQFVLHTIMFITLGSAAIVYPLESSAFIREYRNQSYGLFPYFVTKVVVEIPILILNATILASITYIMTSQPMELHRFAYFWTICILFGWISQAWGLMLGCFFKLQTTAIVGSVSSLIVILLSGVFIPPAQMPLIMRLLSYVSFERYAYEGYLHVIYGMDRKDMDCPEMFCYYNKLSVFLKSISLPELDLMTDFLALATWAVTLTIGFYISLRRKTTAKS